MSDQITCPKCGEKFELTASLTGHLREEIRKEYDKKSKEQEEALNKQKSELDEQLKSINDQKKSLNEELKKRLEAKLQESKAELWKQAQQKAKEKAEAELKIQMQDQNDQLSELKEKLESAQQTELNLLKEKRELEEMRKKQELELMRKLDQERAKIEEEARKSMSEEQQLKMLEYEKKLQDAFKANEDLKRKLQQGSQQLQGEVLELELEEILNKEFPDDLIKEVPKGIRGADIIQTVRDRYGNEAGNIVWELKHTKSWSEGWVTKLKEDQRSVKADVAVLVSVVLPSGIENFGTYKGIWVTNRKSFIGVAAALRSQISAIHNVKLSTVGKNEKMEILYQYLTGNEFKQRVEAIVEAFNSMQEELEKERRWFAGKWSREERNIRKVLDQTHGMYGDLQSMVKSLPSISGLQLEMSEEEIEEISIETTVKVEKQTTTKTELTLANPTEDEIENEDNKSVQEEDKTDEEISMF